MKEFVGRCLSCKKDVYCLDGFLDGVHLDGRLLCFTCYENQKKEIEKSAKL